MAHVLVGRAASPASSVKRPPDVDLIAGVLVCDAAAFCLLKAVERLAATDAVEVQARHSAPIFARAPACAVEGGPPISTALVAGPAVDERSQQHDEKARQHRCARGDSHHPPASGERGVRLVLPYPGKGKEFKQQNSLSQHTGSTGKRKSGRESGFASLCAED